MKPIAATVWLVAALCGCISQSAVPEVGGPNLAEAGNTPAVDTNASVLVEPARHAPLALQNATAAFSLAGPGAVALLLGSDVTLPGDSYLAARVDSSVTSVPDLLMFFVPEEPDGLYAWRMTVGAFPGNELWADPPKECTQSGCLVIWIKGSEGASTLKLSAFTDADFPPEVQFAAAHVAREAWSGNATLALHLVGTTEGGLSAEKLNHGVDEQESVVSSPAGVNANAGEMRLTPREALGSAGLRFAFFGFRPDVGAARAELAWDTAEGRTSATLDGVGGSPLAIPAILVVGGDGTPAFHDAVTISGAASWVYISYFSISTELPSGVGIRPVVLGPNPIATFGCGEGCWGLRALSSLLDSSS